jgi:ribosomal protein L37AE/L43A
MHTHTHSHTQFNTLTVNGARLGLKHKYLVTLRKETNHISRLQTFTFEDIEEKLEEKIYWCAICKSKLTYLPNTDTIWRCDNCLSYYDTKIQDAPIKDKSQLKLRSYHDPYQQYDANDPNIPFTKGIDLET